MMPAELPVERLRKGCDPAGVAESTREMTILETIIGQERAVKALRFGLGIQEPGFNIYVSGMPGTGRTTAVKGFLEEVAKGRPVPDDWCYVNDFREPTRPRALRLPAGRARQFQSDMKALVAAARRDLRAAFESEEYARHREEVQRGFERQKGEMVERLTEAARAAGFLLQSSPMGLMTIPMKGGEPLTEEQFNALKAEEKEAILEARDRLQAEIEATARQSKRVDKGAGDALEKLDQDVARFALRALTEDLKEHHQDLPEVLAYLDEVQADMLQNLDQFRGDAEQQAESPLRGLEPQDAAFRKYTVNVLVDNGRLKGAPVVTEMNPTHNYLFGRIEQEAMFGTLITDFTLIREGALHLANGGYLVLPVGELLVNPFAWEGLKRALSNRQIAIEDAGDRSALVGSRTLKPEAIPLAVKVILIGQPDVYYLLREHDEHFGELFKVRADFDMRMDRTEESTRQYASFVGMVCENETLKHLDGPALARLIEHASRLVDDQDKLSTHFGEIADILREASYYATQDGAPLAGAGHVQKAIDERYYRSSLIVERVREAIARGTILVDVAGRQVGQVNGLSVAALGDIAFGQPSRITATVSLGRGGVIDIEREARLGGPLHTKGVLILSGYLAETYAQDKPLSLSARLVFEQSYGGVDGDSASSAELYALLSSLSGVPIRQGIAVTGSVNQKGRIQPIGGVNEKVEGFFEVCRAQGLTGEQGVVLPAQNVPNLMLKDDVIEAVRQGQFHLWPVSTIDEGMEVLTGVSAGRRQADGSFEEGSVGQKVDRRLRDMAETLRKFGGERGE
jgi:predicted ATP-dependent protease